jgi:hypothetical protein
MTHDPNDAASAEKKPQPPSPSGYQQTPFHTRATHRLEQDEEGWRRTLPDGRVLHIVTQPFNWKLGVSQPENVHTFYDDTWEYTDGGAAFDAFMIWDGDGEPEGWYRHPMSGRRRPDGDPAKEFHRW